MYPEIIRNTINSVSIRTATDLLKIANEKMWLFLVILSRLLSSISLKMNQFYLRDSKLKELPDTLFMDLVYELEED